MKVYRLDRETLQRGLDPCSLTCFQIFTIRSIPPAITSTHTLQDSSFSSVQFSHSVMSDSLRPHEPQHAWPPYPTPTPGIYPNPCPLSPWCHPTISSSVVPFSCCPQSFLASGSFQMSQLFASGGQSIGVSASASVPPMNTQDSFRMDWLDLLAFQGTLKSLL